MRSSKLKRKVVKSGLTPKNADPDLELLFRSICEKILYYQKEKESLTREMLAHKSDKEQLERAVRRRTKDLENKNKELEIANRELASFTFISSHDLQEPLRKIKNYVAVLQQEEANHLSESGKNYLKKTYESAEHMRTLIEDLLKYSRTQRSELVFERTDLNQIVQQLRTNFENRFQRRDVVMKVSKLCTVDVIPLQFRQLFQNLISNSLKFSKPGRKLRISIACKIISDTTMKNLVARKQYCHITYSDNGIGFEPKYSERIFEVFQRLHTAEKYAGTGVGLAICRRIMEHHNGMITATGKPGVGARFDIYIPME